MSRTGRQLTELPEAVDEPLFVYVRIPGEIEPEERGEQFADPLEVELRRAGVGEITGGGTMMSAPDAQGNRTIEYCGIDIDLTSPRHGVALIVAELRKLGAPRETAIEFTLGGAHYEIGIYENSN